jgi:phosphate transport system substrate-binding protein
MAVCAACGVSGFDASRNIGVVAREDGSGTKTAFMAHIGLQGKPDPAGVVIQTGTAGVLAEVRGNPAAIAYESLGYTGKDVKVLQLEGVAATVENIRSGAYILARPLSVVYRQASAENAVYAAFLAFLGSREAADIITENGYVPMSEDPQGYVIGTLSGSIDISGSTSLQPLMIELAAAFEKLQPGIKLSVSGGGSGTGYKSAVEGVSIFGMISEEFMPEKAAGCTHFPVARDGIAVIVNKANPLDSITLAELQGIYGAGKSVQKWNQLVKDQQTN